MTKLKEQPHLEDNVDVSILVPTFNHEAFISECLEGILDQNVNFKAEIIIYDDFSSDKTREILASFAVKFPNIIRLILPDKNQFSLGVKPIIDILTTHGKGKYLAFCDGDDAWTDNLKLMSQYRCLEDNLEIQACFTGHSNVYQISGVREPIVWKNKENRNKPTKIELELTKSQWITKLSTCVIRNDLAILAKVRRYHYRRDIHLFYELLKKGPALYLHKDCVRVNKHLNSMQFGSKKKLKIDIHYLIYKELFEVNRDEYSRHMYTRHFFNHWNYYWSVLNWKELRVKELFGLFKLLKSRRDLGNAATIFLPYTWRNKIKSSI